MTLLSRSCLPAAVLAAAASIVLAAAPAAARTVFVTNTSDDVAAPAPGSFRAAVEEANGDASITSIQFRGNLGTIVIGGTIVYEGEQSLTIDGRGTAVSGSETDTPALFDIFVGTGGGDLTLRRLTFRAGFNGVVVEVPADATGELSASLADVTIEGNANFGLWIDDGTSASAASIGLDITLSRIIGNGLSGGDIDGVRVDEAGEGDITASINNSAFTDNGADGVELDEDGPGDVMLAVRHSTLDGNGVREPEGDDGLDIDEREDGSVWLHVADSTFNGNTDDGIGLDESGNGDLHLSLVQVEASDNGDTGISVDEGDDGDFIVKFNLVRAERNDDNGAELEEVGNGDFTGRVVASTLADNADFGIVAVQEPAGTGLLRLQSVALSGNGDGPIDADGVDVIELGSP